MRTAIARGQSNRKRGRQGHRHTMSIAGYIRTDCRDHKSAQMTESWKSEEGDSKSTQSLALQVSKEQAYGNDVGRDTQESGKLTKMIAMNTCGMSHRKSMKTPT